MLPLPFAGRTWTKPENMDSYFEQIIFSIVPDSTTRRLGLERGDYDFINDVMSYDIPDLEKNEDIRLLGGEESGSIALVFNKRSMLGSSPSFRRAVAYALDYDGVMKACYGTSGYSIHSDYMEKEQSQELKNKHVQCVTELVK